MVMAILSEGKIDQMFGETRRSSEHTTTGSLAAASPAVGTPIFLRTFLRSRAFSGPETGHNSTKHVSSSFNAKDIYFVFCEFTFESVEDHPGGDVRPRLKTWLEDPF